MPDVIDVIPSKPLAQRTCRSFQSAAIQCELPVIDVKRLMRGPAAPRPSVVHASLFNRQKVRDDVNRSATPTNRDLVSVPNPLLVRAIAATLARSSVQGTDDLALLAKPRAAIEAELAPAALLALAVKPLVKVFVKFGMDTYRQDEAELRGLGRRARKNILVRRLLTPMHVVRGLLRDAQRDMTASAVMLSLVPLGMSLSIDAPTSEDLRSSPHQHGQSA